MKGTRSLYRSLTDFADGGRSVRVLTLFAMVNSFEAAFFLALEIR